MELLVVITLLAIAVGGVALQLDGVTTRGRLRSAAGTIGAYHRLARIEAITSGQPRRLVFRRGTSRYLLHKPQHNGSRWHWSDGQSFALPWRVRLDRVIVLEGGSSEPESIRINSDGTAPTYACVLTAGESAAAAVIDGVTGTCRHVADVDSTVTDETSLFTPESSS